MFEKLFKRKSKVKHPDAPQFYGYGLGRTFDAGAMRFAFHREFQNPSLAASGTGAGYRSIAPTQRAIVIANVQTVVAGIPTLNNTYRVQPSTGADNE